MQNMDTFGRRVGLGFVAVSVVLGLAVSLNLWQVNKNAALSTSINETRTPLVRSTYLLLNGVNGSMAAMRGELLFRDPKYRKDFSESWDDIQHAVIDLKRLSVNMEVDNAVKLRTLLDRLEQLRIQQNEVENDALTDPKKAFELLRDRTMPLGLALRDAASDLVDAQDQLLRRETDDYAHNNRDLMLMEWFLLGAGLLSSLTIGAFITRSVTRPMAEAVTVAGRLAAEDFEFDIALQGSREIALFGAALEKMRLSMRSLTSGLREQNSMLERQKRLIDGQVALLERMVGEQTLAALAESILDFLCGWMGAPMGAFYLRGQDSFQALAGHARGGSHEEGTPSFGLREGLIGQAAVVNKPTVVRNVPADHFRVRSGLGESAPRALTLVPITFDGRVSAVLELAMLNEPSDSELEFLASAARNIGIAINLGLVTQKTKELLEETQAQAEELQSQQEELKASNEELETKTRSLQASEEELRATNEELEEQTLLLEREKEALAHRTEEIDRVSRYKSEFLANMSHELRTPLNSILMLSQSLSENRTQNLSERQLKAVQTIHSSGADLLTLIEDILDLSKVEAGKLEIKPEDVPLDGLVETMRQYFEPMARETGLAFHLEMGAGLPPTLNTDPTRVKQVLKNLLSNAFKFTNQGGVTLRIFRPQSGVAEFKRVMATGPCLCFAVQDTGIGIPANQVSAVFEAFKQLDAKTTRKYGGTGLGLSIVRELVSLLGGEVRLESVEGQGTTVTFCLPERRMTIARPAGERARLLLVEDDPSQRQALRTYIDLPDVEIVEAASGAEGLERLTEGPIACIILDLKLTDMDGREFLQAARASFGDSLPPVIIYTGRDLNDLELRALERESKSIIVKGVKSPERLMKEAMTFLRPAADDAKTTERAEPIPNLHDPTRVLKGKTVLVVDDDSRNILSLTHLLEDHSVRVHEAANGREALAWLEAGGQVDLILMDMMMPEMDGYEATRRIRANPKWRGLPVVALTARAMKGERERCLEAGCDDYLSKPIDNDKLISMLRVWLYRSA